MYDCVMYLQHVVRFLFLQINKGYNSLVLPKVIQMRHFHDALKKQCGNCSSYPKRFHYFTPISIHNCCSFSKTFAIDVTQSKHTDQLVSPMKVTSLNLRNEENAMSNVDIIATIIPPQYDKPQHSNTTKPLSLSAKEIRLTW